MANKMMDPSMMGRRPKMFAKLPVNGIRAAEARVYPLPTQDEAALPEKLSMIEGNEVGIEVWAECQR
jgi:hypothetical protein